MLHTHTWESCRTMPLDNRLSRKCPLSMLNNTIAAPLPHIRKLLYDSQRCSYSHVGFVPDDAVCRWFFSGFYRPATSSGIIPTSGNLRVLPFPLHYNISAAAYSHMGIVPDEAACPIKHSATPYSHVGIVLDDAAGRRVISGISHYHCSILPILLYIHTWESIWMTPLCYSIITRGNRAGRCHWPAGIPGILPLPLLFNTIAAPYSHVVALNLQVGIIPDDSTGWPDFWRCHFRCCIIKTLLHQHMWDSCRTMSLFDGFSRGSPVPYNTSSAPYSYVCIIPEVAGSRRVFSGYLPLSCHITPALLNTHTWKSLSRCRWSTGLIGDLVFHLQYNTSAVPYSHVGIVLDYAQCCSILTRENHAGRFRWSACYLGDHPFPMHYNTSAAPYSLVGIVPFDAFGLSVFSGNYSFPCTIIPALLHTHTWE
ncbi:hypothetical protein PR048_033048 [Dryococelus australis]|uniref:Uncharacterized protein n=1 Tax=Dryococelus australis TaxID=614101 RepID=A0ABQ9G2G9_9NEOP|nr:hypothetical protein PR048_033048 [Dryococelus australis]